MDCDRCHYCGDAADTIDHTVPRHLLRRAAGAGLGLHSIMRIRTWEVTSCRECNSLIGGALHATLRDRSDYVKHKLRRRYRHLLEMPKWTTQELEEMGPTMRVSIEANLRSRIWIRARLAWGYAASAEVESRVRARCKNIAPRDASRLPIGAVASSASDKDMAVTVDGSVTVVDLLPRPDR